jgi:hypothetical protein
MEVMRSQRAQKLLGIASRVGAHCLKEPLKACA